MSLKVGNSNIRLVVLILAIIVACLAILLFGAVATSQDIQRIIPTSGGIEYQGATKTWTAAAANQPIDYKFSIAGNWSDGSAPVSGDNLVFSSSGKGPTPVPGVVPTIWSNIPGLILNDFNITGKGSDGNNYGFSGTLGINHALSSVAGFYMATDLSMGPNSLVAIDGSGQPPISGYFSNLQVNTGLNVQLTNSTALFDTLSGSGTINKTGSGSLEIGMPDGFSGTISFSGGTKNKLGFTFIKTSSPNSDVSLATSGTRLQLLATVKNLNAASGSRLIVGPDDSANTSGNIAAVVEVKGNLTLNANSNVESFLLMDKGEEKFGNITAEGGVAIAGAKLKVNGTNNAPFTVGKTYTFINKVSAGPVTGTFAGLPQGATYDDGFNKFQISYTGGDGNDVVLTHTGTGPNAGAINIYRFWHWQRQTHFYTASEAEKTDLINNVTKGWSYELVAFKAFPLKTCAGKDKVFRFYSETKQKHFYTISEAEKNNLIANDKSWKYELEAYCAFKTQQPGTRPLYRFWSDSRKGHFYTTSEAEKANLIANDHSWKYEQIAYYVL